MIMLAIIRIEQIERDLEPQAWSAVCKEPPIT